jgi:hypothetical protein
LKTSDAYSNVICESCNNELRSISAFRKDLIFKQTHLYGFVEGYVENEEETPKDYEQQKVYEASRQIQPIKHETAEKVEIKMEQQDVEDYSTFISTEYLETLQEDEETGGDYGDNYAEDEEFSYVKRERVFKSEDVKMKAMKKHYKRFVAVGRVLEVVLSFRLCFRALCGLCGNSYYKDQLQRHIDVSFLRFLDEFFE